MYFTVLYKRIDISNISKNIDIWNVLRRRGWFLLPSVYMTCKTWMKNINN